MKYIHVVKINGKEVEFETLPKEERLRLVNEWNRRGVGKLRYEPIKTA